VHSAPPDTEHDEAHGDGAADGEESAAAAALAPPMGILAQIDSLRSEGAADVATLRAGGTAVDQTSYTGVLHECFGMGAVVDRANQRSRRPRPGCAAASAGDHGRTPRPILMDVPRQRAAAIDALTHTPTRLT
jgi:hypothetical protein